jgi:3-oxoacyl-[acyl-carrier-protein] synthase II
LSNFQNADTDIVITGLGLITANGVGLELNLETFTRSSSRTSQADYRVVDFNPAPHLTDRKVVKVVSHRDVLGLVAFEECVRNSGLSAKSIDPNRTGLYVGAPPSSCIDHHNYNEAIILSRDGGGVLKEENFGENFTSASPTTLLTGLPNNVLCYGAKTLDARGPNSNYTTLETSAHMAIIGASRSIRLNRLDCAIAGGYTAHSDKVFAAAMKRRNAGTVETPIAEGAAFMTLETRKNAIARGAKIICRILGCGAASDAAGPYKSNTKDPALTSLIQQTLDRAGVAHTDVELIMTTGQGETAVHESELNAISAIWTAANKPILATTVARWGNLMEAGGVAEVGFLDACYQMKSLPESSIIESGKTSNTKTKVFDATRAHAMILRTTTCGEYTCLLVKMGAS